MYRVLFLCITLTMVFSVLLKYGFQPMLMTILYIPWLDNPAHPKYTPDGYSARRSEYPVVDKLAERISKQHKSNSLLILMLMNKKEMKSGHGFSNILNAPSINYDISGHVQNENKVQFYQLVYKIVASKVLWQSYQYAKDKYWFSRN